MKLKDIKTVIQVMKNQLYDENKNQRPAVVDCLIILERKKLLRELQARKQRGIMEGFDRV